MLNRHTLKIESLESRQLLAADVQLDAVTGRLSILGTDAVDEVRVEQSGQRILLTQADGGKAAYSLKEVRELYFLGRGGNDRFVNNTSLPTIAYGNAGDDYLAGGSANDRLYGGPGNDSLIGNGGNDALHGDHGNDVLRGGDGDDDLRGWFGNDQLFGDDGNDRLSGYEGDDLLQGGRGDDDLHGHAGNDRLFGDDGNDLLYGWEGDDLLAGGAGDDYLSGWSGDDLLIGGRGNDKLRGHAGRDVLIGGKESDSLDGGSGIDLLVAGWTKFDEESPDDLLKAAAAWRDGSLSSERFAKEFAKEDGQSDVLLLNKLERDFFSYDAKKDRLVSAE